jgi:hypothetical protein
MLKSVLLMAMMATIVSTLPTPTHKPANKEAEIRIVKNYNEDNGNGSYKWGYETSDGSKQEQSSYLKNAGTDKEIRVVKGSYSHILEDGRVMTVTYISDENGYQPVVTYSR